MATQTHSTTTAVSVLTALVGFLDSGDWELFDDDQRRRVIEASERAVLHLIAELRANAPTAAIDLRQEATGP